MLIKIIPNTLNNPPGKLADAELHFSDAEGALEGLKLIGFGIWERRNSSERNVTFPARAYQVNGERRSFSLLRPIVDTMGQECLRLAIVRAYERFAESVSTDAAAAVVVLPVNETTGIGRVNSPLADAVRGQNSRPRRRSS
jgi:hypothetical protein